MERFKDREEMESALSGVEARAEEWQNKVRRFEQSKRGKKEISARRSVLRASVAVCILLVLSIFLATYQMEESGRIYIWLTFFWLVAIALVGVARRMLQKHR